MKWLLNKRYLEDFEKVGIKIVNSIFTQIGDKVNLKTIF